MRNPNNHKKSLGNHKLAFHGDFRNWAGKKCETIETSRQNKTQLYNLSNLSLKYKLPNKHIVSLSGRYTSSENEKNKAALMVEYTIPFGLPISKKKNIGIVKGYVYGE